MPEANPQSDGQHVPIPLSESDRQRICEAILTKCPEPSKSGPDIPRLVDLIEAALDTAPIIMPVAEPTPEDRRLEEAAADVLAKLRKLREDALALRELITPADEINSFWMHTSGHPLSFVMMGTFPNGFEAADKSRILDTNYQVAVARQALDGVELLATLPVLKRPPERGNREGRGPERQLVRAVCYYRHESGLTVHYAWTDPGRPAGRGKRGGATTKLCDTDLPATDDTTALIVAAARAFRIEASHSELRTCLRRFGAFLQAGNGGEPGRRAPSLADLEY